ncbi:hypothetical protein PCANC_16788 [Puccinia coronata f. sp. avenae]|uniref:Uncharacterized protein n=1 Tax=Puccinia coronata f. sp. avenae TaxID=200324 RepID=A0A2N5S7H2_9BASI|nr:hypothetical protein PCANC_25337 [Puccinia coronata f. sp. avenae]PLW38457.1 hypothetical protein PCASD_10365 [Puccinia coronata f. sp. avenae]PLW39499.1 hypothetical protein PCANC_16788 [Puccinia coronata f. sp. avenae]
MSSASQRQVSRDVDASRALIPHQSQAARPTPAPPTMGQNYFVLDDMPQNCYIEAAHLNGFLDGGANNIHFVSRMLDPRTDEFIDRSIDQDRIRIEEDERFATLDAESPRTLTSPTTPMESDPQRVGGSRLPFSTLSNRGSSSPVPPLPPPPPSVPSNLPPLPPSTELFFPLAANVPSPPRNPSPAPNPSQPTAPCDAPPPRQTRLASSQKARCSPIDLSQATTASEAPIHRRTRSVSRQETRNEAMKLSQASAASDAPSRPRTRSASRQEAYGQPMQISQATTASDVAPRRRTRSASRQEARGTAMLLSQTSTASDVTPRKRTRSASAQETRGAYSTRKRVRLEEQRPSSSTQARKPKNPKLRASRSVSGPLNHSSSSKKLESSNQDLPPTPPLTLPPSIPISNSQDPSVPVKRTSARILSQRSLSCSQKSMS